VTPSSPVCDGPGFHPRKIALGMRLPQQGKQRPWTSPSPRLSPKSPQHSVCPKPRDTTSFHRRRRCPVDPHNDEDFGGLPPPSPPCANPIEPLTDAAADERRSRHRHSGRLRMPVGAPTPNSTPAHVLTRDQPVGASDAGTRRPPTSRAPDLVLRASAAQARRPGTPPTPEQQRWADDAAAVGPATRARTQPQASISGILD
jgi:hypothetical protein